MERPSFPEERDVADARQRQASIDHHGPQPGRVQRYDAATQTADIVPLIRTQRPLSTGETELLDLPVIPSVPVVFPRVDGWGISLKITEGMTGLLVPCDSAIGHWRVGRGDVTDPGDLRRHHIAHSVFVPGLSVRSKALKHPATGDNALVIGSDADSGTRVSFRTDGGVRITQGDTVVAQIDPDGTVHLGGAAGQFVALANLVDANLTAIRNAFDAWSPVPNDGGAALKAAMESWSLESVAATKVKAT